MPQVPRLRERFNGLSEKFKVRSKVKLHASGNWKSVSGSSYSIEELVPKSQKSNIPLWGKNDGTGQKSDFSIICFSRTVRSALSAVLMSVALSLNLYTRIAATITGTNVELRQLLRATFRLFQVYWPPIMGEKEANECTELRIPSQRIFCSWRLCRPFGI